MGNETPTEEPARILIQQCWECPLRSTYPYDEEAYCDGSPKEFALPSTGIPTDCPLFERPQLYALHPSVLRA